MKTMNTMKKKLTILLFLFITTTVLAQQYTYGGKKWDYKFEFSSYDISYNKQPEKHYTQPFVLYIAKRGEATASFSGKTVRLGFTVSNYDSGDYNDDTSVTKIRTLAKQQDFVFLWSIIDKDMISIYSDLSMHVISGQKNFTVFLDGKKSKNPTKIKELYSLLKNTRFEDLKSVNGSSPSSATTKPNVPGEKQTGKDGFVWYKQSSGGKYGALDEMGNVIVPTQYDEIEYKYDDLHHFTHYFKVKNGDHMGAYTRKGYCVVKPEQGWDNVECHSNLHGKVSWSLFKCSWNEATLHMDIFSAMTDAHAKKYVIKPTKGMFIHMDKVYVKNYNYFGENETADEVVFYCRTDSDGRSTEEFAGLIDMDGNYIIYPDEYKSIRVYIDKLELNGVKSNIKIPTGQSSFDYNNFDDLFYK